MQRFQQSRKFNFLSNIFSIAIQKTTKRTMKLQIEGVKGLKKLDRSLFKCQTKLPLIMIEKSKYNEAKNLLKPFLVDLPKLGKRYSDLDSSSNESENKASTHKGLLLDPEKFKSLDESLNETLRTKFDFNKDEHLRQVDVELNYEDFQYDDIMKLILPDELLSENLGAKSFSTIGHIAHFNLRSEILDYRFIIAEVLLDKVNHIKTVVNKINEIDNTYRNFQFEILAGEDRTEVTCKENKCFFKFDFKNVYWNPRLSTEHERIVNLLKENDVVYDVFAGVGPFSIPASTKQKSIVLANDLNPNSYKHLLENYTLNRSKTQIRKEEVEKRLHKEFNQQFERFSASNLDGNEFIRTHVRDHLLKCFKSDLFEKYFMKSKFYALMNLPALATEFLVSFNCLFKEHMDEVEQILESSSKEKRDYLLNTFKLSVYCYCFVRDDDDLASLVKRIQNEMFELGDELSIKSHNVRKVAPNKEMYCLHFNLPFKVFSKQDQDCCQSSCKKLKLDDNK